MRALGIPSASTWERIAPWLAAAAGLAITLLAFWPGYLSWDSAYQWWQARTGELDPAHPPVMVRVWQLSRLVLPDPGGMLLLQATVWWSALALFAHAVGGSWKRRVATVLLTGLWPPLLGVLPHLWKDVWTLGLFALAVACLARDLRLPSRAWRAGALVALALACAFRFNAMSAALPLLAWLAWREWPRRPVIAGLATVVLAGVLQLASLGLNHAPHARDEPVWPLLAMWDIAAVSIEEDRVLFPPDWVDPALTVADLRRDFSPYVNVPSFAGGQLWVNPYYSHTPAQFDALREAWLSLPRDHAGAYFAHRWRLSGYVLGLRQHEQPDYLVLQPEIVAFKDNPVLPRQTGALHEPLQRLLNRLVDVPLFAAWPYLLFSAALVLIALVRRTRGLAAMVALSGWTLVLPLFVIAPSSDFRYVTGCVLAAWLAGWLYWPPDPKKIYQVHFQSH